MTVFNTVNKSLTRWKNKEQGRVVHVEKAFFEMQYYLFFQTVCVVVEERRETRTICAIPVC